MGEYDFNFIDFGTGGGDPYGYLQGNPNAAPDYQGGGTLPALDGSYYFVDGNYVPNSPGSSTPPPTSGDIYNQITGGYSGPTSNTSPTPGSFSDLLSKIKLGDLSGVGSTLKTLFNPSTGPYGAAPLLGLAALLQNVDYFNAPAQAKVGFQGTIPQFTATRDRLPLAPQAPSGYRPGQGGLTYFAPVRYTPSGTPAPQEADTNPNMADTAALVAGLSALAAANRPTTTTAAPTASTTSTSAAPSGTFSTTATPTKTTTAPTTTTTAPTTTTPTTTIPTTPTRSTSLSLANVFNPSPSTGTAGFFGKLFGGLGFNYAAGGGISDLARGGDAKPRFLRGGGDGVSDSIPAQFDGSGAPARLADGEFVIPARVVSELGNGSSEAGARKLYAMMDRVERAAKKAKRGKDSGAEKHLPA